MSSSELSSPLSDVELEIPKETSHSTEDNGNLKDYSEDSSTRKRVFQAKKSSIITLKKKQLTYPDIEEELSNRTTIGNKDTTKLADYEYVATPEALIERGQDINVDEESEPDLELSEESENDSQEPSVQKKQTRPSGQHKLKNKGDFSSDESLEEFFTEYNKKDTNRLTSRQRAKLDDDFQVEFLELPTESKKRHLTAEELALKRSETARRRKNQSERRAEQDKMDTINKLLKKQASRRTKKDDDEQDQREREIIALSKICYLQNKEGSTISFPVDVNPIQAQKFTGYPPSLSKCSIPGCDKNKKYMHSKLLKSVCSLEHYRQLEA